MDLRSTLAGSGASLVGLLGIAGVQQIRHGENRADRDGYVHAVAADLMATPYRDITSLHGVSLNGITTWARPFLLAAALGVALPTAATSAAEEPKVIYGQDNRQEVFSLSGLKARNANGTVALVQASRVVDNGNGTSRLVAPTLATAFRVCASERFRQQPTAARCSGFLAAPNVVVTAGHCVSRSNLANMRFVFGYRMQNATQARTTIPNGDIYRGVQLLADQEGAADFAVVRLDRNVTGRTPLPMQRTGSVSLNTALYVIGHPSGLPAKIAAGAKVLGTNADFFTANLDTYGGNSGSPVFNAGSNAVIGVLVRGAPDYVRQGDCYISNILPDAAEGEASTRTTRIAPFVPAT